MNLEDTLNKKMHKTAGAQTSAAQSAKPTSKTASAVADAVAAVSQSTEKVANAGSVSEAFDKLAADLAEQDQNASVKHAHLYGAAIADGFMAQLGMYEKVAEKLAANSEKVATANDLDPDFVALVKEAQTDPRSFLARVEKAAAFEDEQLKLAEEQEAAALEQAVHVKAAEHYAHGYEIGKLLVSGG